MTLDLSASFGGIGGGWRDPATDAALAGRGAHLVMATRNPAEAAAAADRVRATHPGASVELIQLG